MADKAEEAAFARARALILEDAPDVEGNPEAEGSSGPEASAQGETPEHTDTVAAAEPMADVTVPDEIRRLVEEPDFEEEATQELQPEEGEFDEYAVIDPEEERRKRLAAEKRANWLEGQRAREQRKTWEEEARRYFPHSAPFLAELVATSRRGFLRAASARHDAVKAHIDGQLGAERARLDADRKKLTEEITAQVKAELAQAWGKPTVAAGETPTEAANLVAEVEKLRARRAPLHEIIKARAAAGLNI